MSRISSTFQGFGPGAGRDVSIIVIPILDVDYLRASHTLIGFVMMGWDLGFIHTEIPKAKVLWD